MNEEDSVLGLLYKQLEDAKQGIHDALISGSVQDFASYKELAGRNRGLAMAQALINEMADRLRKQSE